MNTERIAERREFDAKPSKHDITVRNIWIVFNVLMWGISIFTASVGIIGGLALFRGDPSFVEALESCLYWLLYCIPLFLFYMLVYIIAYFIKIHRREPDPDLSDMLKKVYYTVHFAVLIIIVVGNIAILALKASKII